MAHLAWAATAGSGSVPSQQQQQYAPAFDNRSTMSIPGAARRNSTSWSECSTLVELPVLTSSENNHHSTAHPRQHNRSASVSTAPRPASGLLTGDWPGPWYFASHIGPTDGERKKRNRMAQAWQRVKMKFSGAKYDSAIEDGEVVVSPLSSPTARRQQPASPVSPMPGVNNNNNTAGRRASAEFRHLRGTSFTSSASSNRHSWHSSSSRSSSPATVEMVWGSMAAGFII